MCVAHTHIHCILHIYNSYCRIASFHICHVLPLPLFPDSWTPHAFHWLSVQGFCDMFAQQTWPDLYVYWQKFRLMEFDLQGSSAVSKSFVFDPSCTSYISVTSPKTGYLVLEQCSGLKMYFNNIVTLYSVKYSNSKLLFSFVK